MIGELVCPFNAMNFIISFFMRVPIAIESGQIQIGRNGSLIHKIKLGQIENLRSWVLETFFLIDETSSNFI
ncbi:hypothetical protein DBZ36_10595 [Alginatibacterium sediminis]|uniref:Uncharacterized protein n=1 Tax=Alginatibacterium sediminis TaxID=2164068 RepID=A0A420EDT7_9ALTE|nr:hypothetical protein DBZ36_10595 [Alginatibacterium sediminis]